VKTLASPFVAGTMLMGSLFILPLAGANTYYVYLGNMMLIYIIITVGLNIVMGFAGQLVLANAAIFGIGAYSTGLLQRHFDLPYWLSLPVGAGISVILGLVLVLPALRLTGIYLALATLAFAQCTHWVMTHWTSVTFAASGFSTPIPDFSIFGVGPDYGLYYVSWIFCVLLILAARNIVQSKIGRAFVAYRDHEVSAQLLGVDILRYKALAFAISSFYAGIAGGLFAGLLHYVSPESFDLNQMILQLIAVMAGGVASITGSVIGGVLLVVILEISKMFKFSIEMMFGLMLIVIVLAAPGGIASALRSVFPAYREKLHAVEEAPATRKVANGGSE
jgi:branched-chain amino acid transport system permease protein